MSLIYDAWDAPSTNFATTFSSWSFYFNTWINPPTDAFKSRHSLQWLSERVRSDTLERIRGSLLSPQSPSSPLSLKEPTSQWSSLSLANIIALNVMLAEVHYRAGELWEEPLNVHHNEVFPKILGIENQSHGPFNEGLDAGLDCSDFLSQENEVLFWKSRLSSFGLDDNSSWINDLFWWNMCNLMWCMYWILECCKYSMNQSIT